MYKTLLNLIFILGVSSILGPTIYSQEFIPTYYSSKDGLSLGFHGYITQDYKSQIWTTSQGGLSRFNGKNFKIYTYDKTNHRVMNIDENSPIYESRDSILWIGTKEGVYTYDQTLDKFEFLEIGKTDDSDSIGINDIVYIIEDNNGILWLGSFSGLYSYDRVNGNWMFFETLKGIPISHNYESEKTICIIKQDIFDDNILWLGGNSMLYKFDIKNKQYIQTWKLPTKFNFNVLVYDIEQINQEEFYLAFHGNGLNKFNTSTNKLTKLVVDATVNIDNKPYKIVRDILSIDSNRILCTNYSGSLFIYDKLSKKTSYLDDININKKSNQLLKDNDGNIWVTSEEGITSLRKSPVQVFNKSLANIDVDIWDAAYDPVNNCYLGYTTGGNWCFDCYNSKSKQFDNYSIQSKILYNGFIYDETIESFLIIDKKNLIKIKSKEKKIDNYIKLQKGNYQKVFSTKQYLYLTHRYSIDKYNRTGKLITSYTVPDDIIENKKHVTESSFYVFKNNEIFYKTKNQIIRCNDDLTYKSIYFSPDATILDFIIIDDNAYLATTNGLQKCTINTNQEFILNKSFRDPSKSLDLRHITKVNDNLYMSNGSGILGYNYTNSKKILQLGAAENLSYLRNLIYTNGKLHCYSGDKYYQIGLDHQLNKTHNISLIDIVISNYKKPSIYSPHLELQANQNGIAVEWECCYYGPQNHIDYSYKLTGINTEWVSNGNSSRVNFNNLGSGDYELKIRADAIGDSLESSILKFTIHPPWWKTWYFILFVFLAISLISIYFYRWRINKIRSENQHQQELVELELKALRAQMNPHFIFNSLNSIKRLIQRRDNNDAIDYLGNFAMMIRKILSNSDKKMISLEEEIDFCKRYLEMEKLRFQEKFIYFINIEENVQMDSIFVPPLILQPYIENALWHGIMNSGINGILNINIIKQQNTIHIEIDDNGIGRKKAMELKSDSLIKKKSRGMELSKKRSELSELLFDQKIDINIVDKYVGDIAKGTTVVVRINMA